MNFDHSYYTQSTFNDFLTSKLVSYEYPSSETATDLSIVINFHTSLLSNKIIKLEVYMYHLS